MKRVEVRLGHRSYPILIGKNILPSLGSLLKKRGISPSPVVVVSQKPISDRYGASVREALVREGFEVTFFLPPEGKSSESAKTQAVFLKLVRHLAAVSGKNRSPVLIALGGGVVGDLTGFAASVYRRGIPYVQMPTTLTAQVDSAIGGKTAVDLPEGKNLLGAIYQPRMVLADLALLGSLPDRHWSDGFAEVIKYGVIDNPGLFALLEKEGIDGMRRSLSTLERVIALCAKIKARVVCRDEMDKSGVRIVLNFGHTTGHAIETASRFSARYTHGEAVGIGMLVACDIAEKLGVLKDPELPGRLEKTLARFRLPVQFKGIQPATLMESMGYDKKSERGRNRFVLPVRVGKTRVVKDVPAEVISWALARRKG